MPKLFLKSQRAFTIIETMISISVFLVVVMVGMNSLLNANVVSQKSQDQRSIMDNLSFIMEDMSRNIRTGFDYHCVANGEAIPPVSGPAIDAPKSGQSCWGIAFEPSSSSLFPPDSNPANQWIYYIQGGKIFRSTAGTGASNFMQLSPDEVVIDSSPSVSGFSVLGAERIGTDSQQPFVTIRLSGKITYKNVITPFALQTSISQRLIDVSP